MCLPIGQNNTVVQGNNCSKDLERDLTGKNFFQRENFGFFRPQSHQFLLEVHSQRKCDNNYLTACSLFSELRVGTGMKRNDCCVESRDESRAGQSS